MTNAIALKTDDRLSTIVDMVADGLTSEHSRRAYRRAIADFTAWLAEAGRPGFSKATVNSYRAHLVAAGLSPATVNQPTIKRSAQAGQRGRRQRAYGRPDGRGHLARKGPAGARPARRQLA